jgi:acyl-CoA hydrolase
MMIDKKIVEQARNTDMIDFLAKHNGFTFTQKRGTYRCQQHPSLAVKNDRRSWYWHSKGMGGYGAIDYLRKVEQLLFREAIEAVKPGIGIAVSAPLYTAPETPITLFLPSKSGIPIRLYDYLCCKRGVDSEVVHKLIREGKVYEDTSGNVVFVAYDERNKPRYASVRGTYDRVYRTDCIGSDKRFGFYMAANAPSDSVYVFESPIDAMSHASLINADTGDSGAWERDRRLSLAGTSDAALSFFLNKQKSVKELIFCLDNDAAGRNATAVMVQKYAEKGYKTRAQIPAGKDFNADLQALRAQLQAEKRPKSLHRDDEI